VAGDALLARRAGSAPKTTQLNTAAALA
jgi:hypothetical protein